METGAMIANLGLATGMVCATVLIHFVGLLVLMGYLRGSGARFHVQESTRGQAALLVIVVLGLFAIHSVEIWLYAFVYWWIGAIGDFGTALYFSTATFTTLGYGDVTLGPVWRIFGAIEGANGLILFGWSTAFLFAVTGRMRMLQHDWAERKEGQ